MKLGVLASHRRRLTSTAGPCAGLLALLALGGLSALGCRQILGIEDPVACASDDACNQGDRPCVTGECIDGACIFTLREDGFVIDDLEPGDCKSEVCDASGETVVRVVTSDAPADTSPGDCQSPVCDASGTVSMVDDPESCTCELGQSQDCYTGPTGTMNVGVCLSGAASCTNTPDGNVYGDCLGEVTPASWDSCITTDDEDCDGAEATCTGDFVFSKGLGGTGNDYGGPVVEGPSGELVMCGGFSGTVVAHDTVVSDGAVDALLLRLDQDGNPLQAKAFGGAGSDACAAIRLDDGYALNVLLDSGSTESFGGPADITAQGKDGVLVKLDDNLDFVWARNLGGPGEDSIRSVARMPDNGLVVFGTFQAAVINLGGSQLTSAGPPDVYVARYGADGSHMWSKSFGTTSWEEATGLAVSDAGDIYIAGFSSGNVSFGGAAIANMGDYDTVIAKLDSDGNTLWTHAIQSTADDYGPVIAVSPDGSLWAAGGLPAAASLDGVPLADLTPTGGRDLYLAHFAATGAYLGGKVYYRTYAYDYLSPWQLVVGSDGALVLSGFLTESLSVGTTITSAGATDAFIAKFDASGSPSWAKRFGGAASDGFYRPLVRANGDIVVGGTFVGNADFGGGVVTNHDAGGTTRDIVLAKYRQ